MQGLRYMGWNKMEDACYLPAIWRVPFAHTKLLASCTAVHGCHRHL